MQGQESTPQITISQDMRHLCHSLFLLDISFLSVYELILTYTHFKCLAVLSKSFRLSSPLSSTSYSQTHDSPQNKLLELQIKVVILYWAGLYFVTHFSGSFQISFSKSSKLRVRWRKCIYLLLKWKNTFYYLFSDYKCRPTHGVKGKWKGRKTQGSGSDNLIWSRNKKITIILSKTCISTGKLSTLEQEPDFRITHTLQQMSLKLPLVFLIKNNSGNFSSIWLICPWP